MLAGLFCLLLGTAPGAAGTGVQLPYVGYPVASAWKRQLQEGWSGRVFGLGANGAAEMRADGDELVLALDGAPTAVRFELQRMGMAAGESEFVLEESITGESDWGTVIPLARVVSTGDQATGTVNVVGPVTPDRVSRFLRFRTKGTPAAESAESEEQACWLLGKVWVEGGPGGFEVLFPEREDGFGVEEGAAGETIRAMVRNDEGAGFGLPGVEEGSWDCVPWKSNNGGHWRAGGAREVFEIDTSVTGKFWAVARSCGGDQFERDADDPLEGRITFEVKRTGVVVESVSDFRERERIVMLENRRQQPVNLEADGYALVFRMDGVAEKTAGVPCPLTGTLAPGAFLLLGNEGSRIASILAADLKTPFIELPAHFWGTDGESVSGELVLYAGDEEPTEENVVDLVRFDPHGEPYSMQRKPEVLCGSGMHGFDTEQWEVWIIDEPKGEAELQNEQAGENK